MTDDIRREIIRGIFWGVALGIGTYTLSHKLFGKFLMEFVYLWGLISVAALAIMIIMNNGRSSGP